MVNTYETGFKTTLSIICNPTDTVLNLATVPTRTAGRLYLSDGSQEEWISYTGISGSTVTGCTRGLSQTADPATAGTGLTWLAGTKVKLVAMHDQLPDKQQPTTFTQNIVATDITFTGTTTGGLKVKSLTTAQRTGLASPANGMIVYDSTIGENYQYISGSWSAVSAGSTQPNASETVAGKVEMATTAETIAATDTGGTGAKLVALPSDIAKNIQSDTFEYGVDVGGDDTYVFALTPTLAAYTTGQLLRGKVTTGNTGACTADFGPGVKNIKLTDGTDPLTGDILASSINDFIYDGTNLVLQAVAQRASTAEALAGTNAVKYITPATAKSSVQDSIGVPTSVWTASGSGAKTSGNIQAATSGFVTATCGSSFANYVLAYVGATNPATTLIGSCSRNSGQSVYTSLCIPVKKGYYYRLDGSGTDNGDSYQAYFTPSN